MVAEWEKGLCIEGVTGEHLACSIEAVVIPSRSASVQLQRDRGATTAAGSRNEQNPCLRGACVYCFLWLWSPYAAPGAAAWWPPRRMMRSDEGDRCIHENISEERRMTEHVSCVGSSFVPVVMSVGCFGMETDLGQACATY